MIKKLRRGFTLIELLVVIGIIGILAAIVLVAVNPGRQFAQARDRQRQSDLLQITNAIYQFASENSGDLPDTDGDDSTSNFPTTPTCIGNGGANSCSVNPDCSGMTPFNLAAATNEAGAAANPPRAIVPTWIAAMPTDPNGTQADTGYCIQLNGSRVTASARRELDPVAGPAGAITVTR